MKQLFICLLVALSSCGSTCNKDKDIWEEVVFEFAIPVSIGPGTDTIEVGQELVLTADFPDSLFDVLSQKKYYLPDFNLMTAAVIRKLVNPNQSATEQQSAVGNFQITNTVGGLTNLSSTFADVSYSCQNNRYRLETKLKALEAGVYYIRFFHDAGSKGSTLLPQEFAPNEPGFKRFPLMRQIRYNFNEGATHFNIYKENCRPADPNEATNWVESKSTYTFVVR